MRSFVRSSSLALSLAMFAGGVGAQPAFGVRPFVGYYLPVGYYNNGSIQSTALPTQPSELRGLAWGGDVQLELRNRVAIDAVVQTATHTIPVCLCPNGPSGPFPIRVTIAAATAQYDLSPRPSRYHLWASAGPAMIRHSGRGYEQPDSPVSWGGVFGLDLALPLAPHWELVAGGSGVGYWFNLDFPSQRGPQMDAIFSAGVRWHS